MDGPPIVGTFAALCCAYVLYLVYNFVTCLAELRKVDPSGEVFKLLISPATPFGRMMPQWAPKISLGGDWGFYRHHTSLYEKSGWNAFTAISLWPAGGRVTFIGDADAIREVTNDRIRFPKPTEILGVLRVFGSSVLVTEGEEWKKHRRISQPAFSDRNIRLVWQAATTVIEELADEHWGNMPEIRVEHSLDITLQIALMVLSVAAFGKPMSWKTGFSSPDRPDKKDPAGPGGLNKGHSLTFTRALYVVSTHLMDALVAPSWSLVFTKKLREIRRAFRELGDYMDEIIAERKEEYEQEPDVTAKRGDLLTNLIAASAEDQEGPPRPGGGTDKKRVLSLDADELRGNVFIYLIAGHETTAHAFVYIFGLLAIYPEEQEKLYQQAKEVLGDRQATYEDFPLLTRALAVFYEALRMFPPVGSVAKKAAQTTTLRISSANPESKETRDMVIPVNTILLLHGMRVHYDERFFPEPYAFNPDRFLNNSRSKDHLLGFSLGARGCIGRKFAEVEVVAVLTALIGRYTIHLTEETAAKFKALNLSQRQQAEHLLKSKVFITTTPLSVPLVFRRRDVKNN